MRSTLAAVVCGNVSETSLSWAAVARGSADRSGTQAGNGLSVACRNRRYLSTSAATTSCGWADLPDAVAATVGRGASGTRVAR
eukprot:6410881-Pyramimonas_sp.AAC.1